MKPKFKVGDTVVPHSKSVGLNGIGNCENWIAVRDTNHPYLYVRQYVETMNCYYLGAALHTGENDASMYVESDLSLYVSPKELKVGDTVRVQLGRLDEMGVIVQQYVEDDDKGRHGWIVKFNRTFDIIGAGVNINKMVINVRFLTKMDDVEFIDNGKKVIVRENGDVTYGCTTVSKETVDKIIATREKLKK